MDKITVVGSLNMDLTISAKTFPGAGETVPGDSFQTDCGGKGANQAISAANLGANVSMIGCVGDDAYGKILTENLSYHRVDTSHISVCQKTPSGVAMILLSDGDNRIIVSSGANGMLTSGDIEKSRNLLERSKIVLAQLEVPLESVVQAFGAAKKSGGFTVLNPSPIRELPASLLEKTDLLILNEHEAATLTKKSIENSNDAKNCISTLLSMGVKQVILTLGAQGCVYTTDSGIFTHPARKVEAVDTTGAGDSFCGAVIYALARDIPMHDAIKLATLVSSLTVTRMGTTSAFPSLDEIKNIQKKEGISIALS